MFTIALIDNGTTYTNNLRKLLENYNLKIISCGDSYTFLECDLIILSGGHKYSIVNHKDYYGKELDFIRNNKIPLIGICLGAELLAYAFGSKLESLHHKELGLMEINISDDKVFEGIDYLTVYESHRWAIKELGPDLIGLAKSADGFEVIKHKNLPFYGLQFHPEMVADKNNGNLVFTNILKRLVDSKSE